MAGSASSASAKGKGKERAAPSTSGPLPLDVAAAAEPESISAIGLEDERMDVDDNGLQDVESGTYNQYSVASESNLE